MASSGRGLALLFLFCILSVTCQGDLHSIISTCEDALCEFSYAELCFGVVGNASKKWDRAARVFLFAADERDFTDLREVDRLASALQAPWKSHEIHFYVRRTRLYQEILKRLCAALAHSDSEVSGEESLVAVTSTMTTVAKYHYAPKGDVTLVTPVQCALKTLPSFFVLSPTFKSSHSCDAQCTETAIGALASTLRDHIEGAEGPYCGVPYSPRPGGWRGFRVTSFDEEDSISRAFHEGMEVLWKSALAVGYHTPHRTLKSFGDGRCGLLSTCRNWRGYTAELPIPYYHTGRWSYLHGGGLLPGAVAALSDWVITKFGIWGDLDKHPKTVTFYLQAREAFFNGLTSPDSWVKEPIVVIGMEDDCTFPVGLDPRGWCEKRRGEEPHRSFYQWADSPLNRHVFVENMDTMMAGLGSIPTGFTPFEFPQRDPDILLQYQEAMALSPGFGKLSERNFCVSFQNRINHSEERPIVRDNCNGAWKPFCRDFNTGKERYINETWSTLVRMITANFRGVSVDSLTQKWQRADSHFFDLAHCQFVLCVHGGGVDPSPKTFETILSGSIPIIQSYAVDLSYQHLPVVIVKNITSPTAVTQEKMEQWKRVLGKYYEEDGLRRMVLERLRTGFWWSKVQAAVTGEEWAARDGLPEILAVFAD